MLNSLRFTGVSFCSLLALITAANAQGHKPKTDAEHIANAISAGPFAISHDATIMAMDGDKMRTIRQGKNDTPACPMIRARPATIRCVWIKTPWRG